MIFAELADRSPYWELHTELVAFLTSHFPQIQSGLQGDSWIWILDGEEKVSIDTFTSMKHQIKSDKPGPHVQKVIEVMRLRYAVNVYGTPELEAHEDD